MPEGEVLEFAGVTKRFGDVSAVSDFSARVEPGSVTGFLGPNGAGKTTTLRILLGLVGATEGRATIGGKLYRELENPLATVGAVLEASSFHPGRTAAAHLKIYAQAAALPANRVDEALAAVGLTEVGGRKVGGFSLGMRQRLGLAFALLGDPGVLVLDEPANGLDPEGIIWMRGLLRSLADQGRTVLVSSHLLAEMQQSADRLLIISQGRLVFQGASEDLSEDAEHSVVADSPDRAALAAALTGAGVAFDNLRSGLTARGVDAAEIGRIALGAGVPLAALQRRGPSLEDVFLGLVSGERVHPSASGVAAVVPPAEDAADGTDAPDADASPTAAATTAGQVELFDAGAAESTATSDEVAADVAAELDGMVGGSPAAAASAGFAVAATGVIDIVPPADEEPESEPGTEAEPESERAAEAEPEPAPDADSDAEPEPAPDADPDAASEHEPATHPAFAVAATGVIDVVGDTATDDPDSVPGESPAADAVAVAVAETISEDPDIEMPEGRTTEGPIDRVETDRAADEFFSSFDDDPERHDPESDEGGQR